MKVAICAIGRQENLYILEWVNYYKNMGFDKIFLYDNNYGDEEGFDEVLSEQISNGFVDVINYRDRDVCQVQSYGECYKKHGGEYDWIVFIDIDEFLHLVNFDNINDFLSQDKFKDYNLIHINWMQYSDNGQIYYKDKPVQEQFTEPVQPLDYRSIYEFPHNNHVKSIVRGGLNNVRFSTPHTPSNVKKCCDALGRPCTGSSAFNNYDFSEAYFKHFCTKSLEEFLTIKVRRGYPDGNKDHFKKTDPLVDYFRHNEDTPEKREAAMTILHGSNKIDLFIASHGPFTPKVHNPTYKILTIDENDKYDYGLKKYLCNNTSLKAPNRFYSELWQYKWVLNNIKDLKEYVGFLGYRKYYPFYDKIPNFDEYFEKYDILYGDEVDLDFNTMLRHADLLKIIRRSEFNIVGNIIAKYYPEYTDAFEKTVNGDKLKIANAFIMKRDDFIKWGEFVYGVLEKYVEVCTTNRIDLRVDNRTGGHIGERLTHVFISKWFKNPYKIGLDTTKKSEASIPPKLAKIEEKPKPKLTYSHD